MRGTKVERLILHFVSLASTGIGVYLLFRGNLTDGLLALILGELIDIPKYRLGDKTE